MKAFSCWFHADRNFSIVRSQNCRLAQEREVERQPGKTHSTEYENRDMK